MTAFSAMSNANRQQPYYEVPPADWDPPALTIFIIGVPRSGTTLLCRALASTGVAGTPKEYFGFVHLPDRMFRYDDDPYLSALKAANIEGRTPNGVVSIKCFCYQFEEMSRHARISSFFTNSKFVYVRRRDLIRRSISHLRALQTKQWNSENESAGEPVYDPVEIERLIWKAELDQARWNVYLAVNEIEPLCLWYEEIAADLSGAVRKVLDFCGVDYHTEMLKYITPNLRVQRDRLSEDWRSRFLRERRDLDILPPVGWRARLKLEVRGEKLSGSKIIRKAVKKAKRGMQKLWRLGSPSR